jgi:hypothetical protein
MPLDLSKVAGVTMQSPRDLVQTPTFLLYGRGKTGKTTLAMSSVKVPEMGPVAIIDFEGSAEVGAEDFPDVDVYRATNWTQAAGLMDAMLNQKHEYKTVILDPVNALQAHLTDEIVRRQPLNQPNAKPNNSMGDAAMLLSDWGVVWTRMRKILEAFHAAPFTVILTAHADSVKDETTGKMVMEPLMQGNKTKNEVTRVPTVVGYMRMVQKEDGSVIPVARFAGGGTLVAGDRTKKLGVEIENPTMQTIYNKIHNSNNK